MPITTYAELQAEIAEWIDRDDSTDAIKQCISLAEDAIRPHAKTLSSEVKTDLTCVPGDKYLALPANCIGVRTVHISASPDAILEQLPLSRIIDSRLADYEGQPKAFAISDDSLVFAPTPSTDFTVKLTYYEFQPLSDANTSNDILANYPGIYFAASLAHGFKYTKDTENSRVWESVFGSMVSSTIKSSNDKKFGGGLLRAVPETVV
jgi:hypothetical protein